MHIFFSGIGGGAIGPLALIAKQAGYDVSGSDKQASDYTYSLQKQGIQFYIGQSEAQIAELHSRKPIDWVVYSSAVTRENPDHAELKFAEAHRIKHSKRDELLNKIIQDKQLKMVAVAGTHGKSTTTAMVVWLFHDLGMPLSYSVGAKIPFGPMGQLDLKAEWFAYECDEFDRNFLAFHPDLSLITGIGWDHHEVFPTRESYNQAFLDFIHQSKHTIIWDEELELLKLPLNDNLSMITANDLPVSQITLAGLENRLDAWQAVQAVHQITGKTVGELIESVNRFPGLKQRMEKLAPNLYSNYAHTPEKIKGGMRAALDIAVPGQEVVIIYEPLTNRRQHFIKHEYKNTFAGAKKVHWVRTYLAREDPKLPLLTPAELIQHLDDPKIAEPAELDESLVTQIRGYLKAGDMVVGMGASGAGSLDEWLRTHLPELTT